MRVTDEARRRRAPGRVAGPSGSGLRTDRPAGAARRGSRSSPRPAFLPKRPAATVRAWIGLGCQRGSWKLCSQKDFATSKLTSTPTRSISSNGPMRKPPPSAHDPVDLVDAGDALAEHPQGLERERPGEPVGDEADRIRRLDRLAAASRARPRWRPRAVSGAVSSPATISTRRISGGGLKKCIPHTRSGRSTPAAIAVTEREEVLVARIALGPAELGELGEQGALQLEVLRRRLDHELALRPASSTRSTRFSRPSAASASASLHIPRTAPFARPSATRA